ncbi:hypothetical protein CPB85DRAFT_914744 [Mucidula mucida]|nr:hypothetical protein CPB85DRAFT_914744 [Mucidula mucida]
MLPENLSIYRSAFAPIRSLPRDVALHFRTHVKGKICLYGCRKASVDSRSSLSLMAGYCSLRHSLWASVYYFAAQGTRDTVIEIMQEYLRRSGQHPLSVVLEGKYHAPVYDLLGEYHRWRLLYVMDIDSSFASRLSSLPGSIQQLEELYIIKSQGDCTVFLRATRLRRVWTSPRLSLPSLEHTTHYSARLTVSELNPLSESLSPSLTACEIEVHDSSSSDVESPPLLIHNSHLKQFEICGDTVVLNRLVLPALTTLGIRGSREDPAVVGSAISSFIQRLLCSLTTLILAPGPSLFS